MVPCAFRPDVQPHEGRGPCTAVSAGPEQSLSPRTVGRWVGERQCGQHDLDTQSEGKAGALLSRSRADRCCPLGGEPPGAPGWTGQCQGDSQQGHSLKSCPRGWEGLGGGCPSRPALESEEWGPSRKGRGRKARREALPVELLVRVAGGDIAVQVHSRGRKSFTISAGITGAEQAGARGELRVLGVLKSSVIQGLRGGCGQREVLESTRRVWAPQGRGL
ncbi:uncharacterized protein LOC132489538 [Mesoplodon densirostris]|uniref:uncharacterized protein LOC132489538 n=1 Tax=Mesoplodon densirostris TaxID=48708 RepID=UPI0028DC2A0F|nr:uncharacterized protein LOC132489538 [Mesoplodon densirostris]